MFPNTKVIKAGSHFEIAVTTDRSGRTSVVITKNPLSYQSTKVVDVELPAQTGEYKDAFPPTVKVGNGIQTETV
jgi:hypothetical protein